MSPSPRVCISCNLAFRTTALYYRHIRRDHRTTFCARCVAHFPSAEAKEEHMRSSEHHNQCHLCLDNASYVTRANLEKHITRKHPGCGVCGLFFRTVDERNQHEMSHPSCQICRIALRDANAVDNHEVAEHFKCHYCERFFGSHSNLINHFKTHASKDIPCPACPKSFISHSALVLHFETNTCTGGMTQIWVYDTAQDCAMDPRDAGFIEWQNPDLFPFKCPTCHYSVRLMSALMQHAESEACAEDIDNGPLTDFALRCEEGEPHRPFFGGGHYHYPVGGGLSTSLSQVTPATCWINADRDDESQSSMFVMRL